MTPRERIVKITELFGMKQAVAAKAMNITTGVFAKNMSKKDMTHNFNENHVKLLKTYVLDKSEELEDT